MFCGDVMLDINALSGILVLDNCHPYVSSDTHFSGSKNDHAAQGPIHYGA